jgi:hypothetical protein
MTKCKSMLKPMLMDLNKMNDDDSNEIFLQLIGSLMYLVKPRLNICYEVDALSQFMSQPRQTHWTSTKHVLRYLRGIVGYGMRYASSVDLSLQGYAEWTKSTVDRKSTYGCCFTLKFSMISWCSRKQRYVALSTIETKYITLSVRSSVASQDSDRFT